MEHSSANQDNLLGVTSEASLASSRSEAADPARHYLDTVGSAHPKASTLLDMAKIALAAAAATASEALALKRNSGSAAAADAHVAAVAFASEASGAAQAAALAALSASHTKRDRAAAADIKDVAEELRAAAGDLAASKAEAEAKVQAVTQAVAQMAALGGGDALATEVQEWRDAVPHARSRAQKAAYEGALAADRELAALDVESHL